jgi:hypothetical protein
VWRDALVRRVGNVGAVEEAAAAAASNIITDVARDCSAGDGSTTRGAMTRDAETAAESLAAATRSNAVPITPSVTTGGRCGRWWYAINIFCVITAPIMSTSSINNTRLRLDLLVFWRERRMKRKMMREAAMEMMPTANDDGDAMRMKGRCDLCC